MKLLPVAENIWVAQYPQRLVGIDFGRNVTIIRLQDGRLVIHSTAAFEAEDLMQIRELGQPAWLLDATLFHDSFAREGCRAFARIPYFAPRGLRDVAGVTTLPLESPPTEWAGELEMLLIDGVPKVREHVFYHRASRTLILADLLFHFPAESRGWTRFFVRNVMRLPRLIGMSAFLRMMVRDKAAFKSSIARMMKWDFERIVVGHGEAITEDPKAVLLQTLSDRGLAIQAAPV